MTNQMYTIETVPTVNFIYKIPHIIPANNITYWTELQNELHMLSNKQLYFILISAIKSSENMPHT